MEANHKPGYGWPTAIGVIIALVQLADIAIHVATDQAEAMRIVSNIIVLAGACGIAFKRGRRYAVAAAGSTVVYLALNLLFLLQNGITNPQQGDQPRTALLLLVLLTLVLSAVQMQLARKRAAQAAPGSAAGL